MNKEDLKRKAIELHNAGKSYGEIATQLEVGKTTVYNWIIAGKTVAEKKVPIVETIVPNRDRNELLEYKEGLKNEYGIENDIQSLVALRKAEMEYQLQMEKVELEREHMLHKQKMEEESFKSEHLTSELEEMKLSVENASQKTERLGSNINQLKQNNELLSMQLDNITARTQIIELDEDLLTAYKSQISNYLDLEGEEITIEEVENILGVVEKTIKNFKRWIKNNNGKKSDYPEVYSLKQIQNSLKGMINEIEDSSEDELVFEFNSDFEEELKELFT